MNLIDGIIIIALGSGAIWGFRNGLIKALLGFVAIAFSIWAGFKFSSLLEDFVSSIDVISEEWVPIASIIFGIFLAYTAIKFIARFATKAVKAAGLGMVNRVGGAVIGLLINAVIVSAALSYLSPFLDTEMIAQSRFYPLLNQLAEFMGANMDFLKEQIDKSGIKQQI